MVKSQSLIIMRHQQLVVMEVLCLVLKVKPGDLSLAVGAVSQAVGTGATAMGATSVATGNRSNAIGYNAKVEAEDGIAFGTYSKVSGVGSVNSIAMGLSANTDKKSAIAIGQNAKVTLGDGSVAIGSNSEDKRQLLYPRRLLT